ncbi:MAG TPA: hypothetical protein VLJ62_08455, partial [Burkholderiaceae bacterium]|nr:hypothetical protein [Burkholderiaceae bacterium]
MSAPNDAMSILNMPLAQHPAGGLPAHCTFLTRGDSPMTFARKPLALGGALAAILAVGLIAA